MRSLHTIILCTAGLSLSAPLSAQQFGAEETITTWVSTVSDVFAADLDGDGDTDVISSSRSDDKIAMYRNLGGGVFGPQILLAFGTDARAVYAEDLDGDGDIDVLAAASDIVVFENLGGGVFGNEVPVVALAAEDIFAIDLDGDGDADLLSASFLGITWNENLGGGSFGPVQTISSAVVDPKCVFSIDLDGDGDADVLSASRGDDKVAWYENLGGGVFGVQQVLTVAALDAWAVFAADLDGDGDLDVISGGYFTHARLGINWNLGGGSFSTYQTIFGSSGGCQDVFAADLDGDGDADLLADAGVMTVWHENLGGGTFGAYESLTRNTLYGKVLATDIDGNGTPDVLVSNGGTWNSHVSWFRNLDGIDTDEDNDGLHDFEEGSLFGTDPGLFDTDGDGLSDGQELGVTYATAPSGTDPLVFSEDTDPLTTTDPLLHDTDGGGTSDGNEDVDKNGALDIDEHDPNNSLDDLFQLSVTTLSPGQQATISVSGCRPGSVVIPLLSTAGLGSRLFPIYDQLELSLQNPITQLAGITVNGGGTASTNIGVPLSTSIGLTVHWQALEITGGGDAYRPSIAITEVVQ